MWIFVNCRPKGTKQVVDSSSAHLNPRLLPSRCAPAMMEVWLCVCRGCRSLSSAKTKPEAGEFIKKRGAFSTDLGGAKTPSAWLRCITTRQTNHGEDTHQRERLHGEQESQRDAGVRLALFITGSGRN